MIHDHSTSGSIWTLVRSKSLKFFLTGDFWC